MRQAEIPRLARKTMEVAELPRLFYMLRTVRRAAEGEPPRLEAGSRYMEKH